MKNLLGSLTIFISTYFLLSIDLKNKTIFDHIYYYTSPYTSILQKKAENFVKFSILNSKDFTVKIFKNSIPSQTKSQTKHSKKAPADSLTEADREELQSLIKDL
jgi:hypothetical protein